MVIYMTWQGLIVTERRWNKLLSAVISLFLLEARLEIYIWIDSNVKYFQKFKIYFDTAMGLG